MKWSKVSTLTAFFFVGILLVTAGCAEPTRDEYVHDVAAAGCDRFEECGRIGEGEDYESYGECVSDLESTFYDMWPSDECSNGRINEAEYDRCFDRAINFPCNGDGLDKLSYALDCGADDVCIDPPD